MVRLTRGRAASSLMSCASLMALWRPARRSAGVTVSMAEWRRLWLSCLTLVATTRSASSRVPGVLWRIASALRVLCQRSICRRSGGFGLGKVGAGADVGHAGEADVLLEVPGDELGAVVGEDARGDAGVELSGALDEALDVGLLHRLADLQRPSHGGRWRGCTHRGRSRGFRRCLRR